MPTLRAIPLELKGERIFKCGDRNCKGRLATFRLTGDNGLLQEVILILPVHYDMRKDGVYAKTKRAHSRTARVREQLALRKTIRALLDTPLHRRQVVQNNQLKHGREYDTALVIYQSDLPITVACPGCQKLSILSSITGKAR